MRAYARFAVSRGMDGFYVAGLDAVAEVSRSRPLLFCANHTSFWDGLALILLDEALGTDGFALMDQHNWKRLSFFRAVGALPLDTSGGAATRRQLDDAAGLLDRPRRAVWIFPQGRQRAAHLRPLGFKGGLRVLAGRAARHHALVVPVALSYAWRDAPSPVIVARLGTPVDPATIARQELVSHLEAETAALLDESDAWLDSGAQLSSSMRLLVSSRAANVEHSLGSRLLARFWGQP